jgi:hypothetical protein
MSSKEAKYDVSIKVGCGFIFGCFLLGLIEAFTIVPGADRLGIIHLGGLSPGVHHLSVNEALVDGLMGGVFGIINGVALSIRRQLWFVGLVVAIIPCGIFGGFAGYATPHPYSPAANVITYLSVPLLIAGSCVLLRKQVWQRYQKPVVGGSKGAK